MKINKRYVEQYNATFMSFVDSPSAISNEFYVKGIRRLLIGQEIKPKVRALELFFENENDISRFIAEIQNGCIIDHEHFVYQCFLADTNPIIYNHIGRGMYEVKFNLSTIKMGHEQIYAIGQETSINVNATYDSPAIYYVDVLEDVSQIDVDGYIINNLVAGDKVIINGFEQTVKCNNENKFSDVKLKDNVFPMLKPGINHLQVAPVDKIEVKLKVYPIWI